MYSRGLPKPKNFRGRILRNSASRYGGVELLWRELERTDGGRIEAFGRDRAPSDRASSDERYRHSPGASPARVNQWVAEVGEGCRAIADRTNRSVGNPTAAVIRRTWRFLPSVSVSANQAVGTLLRNRIGGSRGGKSGSELSKFT
jgi:hypothetical protein